MPDPNEFSAEKRMGSAGAELMALSHRLATQTEFAKEADRIREIGAWVSLGRTSDLETASLKVMGSMIRAMRRRNFAFSDDRPISTQFEEFLDGVLGTSPVTMVRGD